MRQKNSSKNNHVINEPAPDTSARVPPYPPSPVAAPTLTQQRCQTLKILLDIAVLLLQLEQLEQEPSVTLPASRRCSVPTRTTATTAIANFTSIDGVRPLLRWRRGDE